MVLCSTLSAVGVVAADSAYVCTVCFRIPKFRYSIESVTFKLET